MIEGKIRTRKYESQGQDRYITEHNRKIELLGRPQGGDNIATRTSRPADSLVLISVENGDRRLSVLIIG